MFCAGGSFPLLHVAITLLFALHAVAGGVEQPLPSSSAPIFNDARESQSLENRIDAFSAVSDDEMAVLDCRYVDVDEIEFELLSDRTTLTAYYPSRPGDRLDGTLFSDVRGLNLQTLQDYLEYRSEFVTVAMDPNLRIPYGTPLCVPSLNRNYGQRIPLEVRDSDADLDGQDAGQVDICVRTETDSYDEAVNEQGVEVYIANTYRRHLEAEAEA